MGEWKQISCKVEELKPNDRVHFFWQEFPDGSKVNGGSNIIELREIKDEYLTDQIRDDLLKNDYSLDELIMVCLQIDYFNPSWHAMPKDWIVSEVYREE